MLSAEARDTPSYKSPYDHQIEDVAFMMNVPKFWGGKGVLLCNEPGTGKTGGAAIAAFEQATQLDGPALIVCPKSLKLNWEQEIRSFIPNAKVYIGNSKEFVPIIGAGNFSILNYDIVTRYRNEIKKAGFKVLILDESQYIKNGQEIMSKAKRKRGMVYDVIRTDAIFDVSKNIPVVHCLTGTPVVSRPKDAWNQLKIIEHPITEMGWTRFMTNFCDAKDNGYGLQIGGASNLEELHNRIKPHMRRVLKSDVLDMPEKTRHMIPVDTDLEKYFDTLNKMKNVQESKHKKNHLAMVGHLQKLKSITAKLKLKHTFSIAMSIIESGESVVIGSDYVQETILWLKKQFEKRNTPCVLIHGGVSEKERNQAVNSFQSSEVPMVFLGQMQAAGVGLTLTRASNLIVNDLPFVPGTLVQFEDRIDRIGQKNVATIHYPLARYTFDDELMPLLIGKIDSIDKIMQGKSTLSLTEESIVNTLIHKLLMISKQGIKISFTEGESEDDA